MATTLGGTTLSDAIFECHEVEAPTAYQRRMGDGTLKTDHADNSKRRWSLNWRVISQSDVDTILTEYADTASQVFSPPDTATTYTVFVVRGSLSQPRQMMGSTARWNLGFQVEEE